jgi:hypothetical protein
MVLTFEHFFQLLQKEDREKRQAAMAAATAAAAATGERKMEDPVGSYRTTDLEQHEVKAGLQQFAQSTPTAKAGSSGTAGLPKKGGSSSRAVSTLKKPKTANVDKTRRSEMREMSSSASTQDDDGDDFA